VFDILSQLEAKEGLMRMDEVAKLFSVSRRTIERMVADSEIPSLLVAGQRRFDPASLHRYITRKSPMLARDRKRGTPPENPDICSSRGGQENWLASSNHPGVEQRTYPRRNLRQVARGQRIGSNRRQPY
jgi:excisionase family DNA binding protein